MIETSAHAGLPCWQCHDWTTAGEFAEHGDGEGCLSVTPGTWYILGMSMRKTTAGKKTVTASAKGEFVIGRAKFAKISAVEGIRASSSMKKRAAQFDRKGLSSEERRKAIIRAHTKG
jgi:hypothetical protein